MYVVIGATGHTGSVVAEKLLAKGEKVRVVGRDARRLERLKQKGAEAFVADVTDASAMARAFSGREAAYVMVPPNMSSPNVRSYQEHVNDVLASALEKSGVKYAVTLSSIGADKADKTGPVVGLRTLEQLLETIAGLNVLFLRAGYFMEHLLPQVLWPPDRTPDVGPVPRESRFGRDDDPAAGREHFPDQLLAHERPIAVGGIDEVDAQLAHARERSLRFGDILRRTPDARSREPHGSETEPSHFEIASQLPVWVRGGR